MTGKRKKQRRKTLPYFRWLFCPQINRHLVPVLAGVALFLGDIEAPIIQPAAPGFLLIEHGKLRLRPVVHHLRRSAGLPVLRYDAVPKESFKLFRFCLLLRHPLDSAARIVYTMNMPGLIVASNAVRFCDVDIRTCKKLLGFLFSVITLSPKKCLN